jgi:hypothetical protein
MLTHNLVKGRRSYRRRLIFSGDIVYPMFSSKVLKKDGSLHISSQRLTKNAPLCVYVLPQLSSRD